MPHRIPTGKGNYSFNLAINEAKMSFPNNNNEFSFNLNELREIRNWYYIAELNGYIMRTKSKKLIKKIEKTIQKINKNIKEAIT